MPRMMTNVIPSQSQFRFLSRIEDQGGNELKQLSDWRMMVTNKRIGINCMPSKLSKTLNNKEKYNQKYEILSTFAITEILSRLACSLHHKPIPSPAPFIISNCLQQSNIIFFPCFTWCWNALWNLIMWCDAMLLSYMLSFSPPRSLVCKKMKRVNKQLFKWLFSVFRSFDGASHVVQSRKTWLVIPARL